VKTKKEKKKRGAPNYLITRKAYFPRPFIVNVTLTPNLTYAPKKKRKIKEKEKQILNKF